MFVYDRTLAICNMAYSTYVQTNEANISCHINYPANEQLTTKKHTDNAYNNYRSAGSTIPGM